MKPGREPEGERKLQMGIFRNQGLRRIRRLKYKLIFLVMSLSPISTFVLQMPAFADVRVAPVALYLSDANRTGRIVVENMSAEPRDIEIDLRFGYPVSDENGDISMRYIDSTVSNEPSAKDWIRAYPRRLTLLPGRQQTIRFAARPPAELPNGEYWVRPIITSRPVEQDKPAGEPDGKVSVYLGVTFKTVISINYRRGKVSTGIEIHNPSTHIRNNRLILLVDLSRTGNAAFLGKIVVRIRDSNGKIREEMNNEIAVYHFLRRRMELNLEGLPRGSYNAEIEVNTDRQALADGDILRAEAVSKTLAFLIVP